MKLTTIQDRLWAVHPAKLQEIDKAISALISGQTNRERFHCLEIGAQEKPSVPKEIAVIDITGTISKRANLITNWSGGVSTQLIKKQISEALNDPAVRAIMLNIDSPGGTVDGVDDLSTFIRESRKKKPITAYVDGMMASAAYWIGSASERIIASKTSMIGSIGVAVMHYDLSGMDAKQGIVRTEIYSGRYKRIASNTGPLTEEARSYLQELVDKTLEIFLNAVALNRNMSFEQALAASGESRIFMAQDALSSNLIDHVGTFAQAVELVQKTINDHNGRKSIMEDTLRTESKELYPDCGQDVEPACGNEAEARLAQLAEENLKLKRALRSEQLQRQISSALAEFRLSPSVASDPKLIEALLAVDSITATMEDGTGFNVGSYFMETFITGAEKIIPDPTKHFASDETVCEETASMESDAVKIGRRIAERANRMQLPMQVSE